MNGINGKKGLKKWCIDQMTANTYPKKQRQRKCVDEEVIADKQVEVPAELR